MPPSYRLINFSLRPAKAVERRMIVEVCSRLGAFSNLLRFRYVGLGSPFFNDFALMHRRYGMTNLISIERESGNKDRFVFNKPFDCIQLVWGESTDELPNLYWDGIPSIVWMDYDDPINEGMMADIGTIVRQLEPGSMVLFTVQAEGNTFKSKDKSSLDGSREKDTNPLDRLREKVGDFVPHDTTPEDMRGKRFQKLVRRIVDNEFKRALSQRNAAVPPESVVQYKQLFNVLYADGVRMTTIGGVIFRADQAERVSSCEFSDFEFLREGDDPFEIRVPVLTYREQLRLSAELPSGNPVPPFLAPGDVSAYRTVYRYYPTFIETDL